MVRKAFCDAFLGASSSYQKPISRYEQSPISSHIANVSSRSLESTSASIAAVNSETTAKYQPLRESLRMYASE